MNKKIIELSNYFGSLKSDKIEALFSSYISSGNTTHAKITSDYLFEMFNNSVPFEINDNGIKCVVMMNFCYSPFYNHYKNEMKILSDEVKAYVSNSNNNLTKIEVITNLYIFSILNKSDETVRILNEIGGNKLKVNFFIDLEEFENIMLGIIKKGFIVDCFEFLILTECIFKQRIYKTISEDFLGSEVIRNYDKRVDVPSIAIEYKNIIRKKDYNSQKPIVKNEFENAILNLITHFNEKIVDPPYNIECVFDDLVNLRKSIKEYKKLLLKMLMPSINIHGNSKTKEAFKPYFRFLFENNESGFFNEQEFIEKYSDVIGKNDVYDGNYKKYYNSRIKSLVGI